jgi:hypothetical protein
MQQLTLLEFQVLTSIKMGDKNSVLFPNTIIRLEDMGLVKKSRGKYKIIPGSTYNYCGNSYKL